MLSGLKLINFSPCEKIAQGLRLHNEGQVYVLKTCQRTMVIGFNKTPESILRMATSEQEIDPGLSYQSLIGTDAYEFLLETICGLKSRVVGENEIVHQFKEAYSEFIACSRPNRLVQNLLEKLFKDAKDIRSQHLKNIGLQTYAGITRKLLTDRVPSKSKVILLGSGELAEDIIKIIHRRYQVIVCARNNERVTQLCEQYNISAMPWSELAQALGEAHIINTIGSHKRVLTSEQEKSFLVSPNLKTFVCLAEPKPYNWENHPLNKSAKTIFLLEDIFECAQEVGKEKQHKIAGASEAIKEKSKHRQNHFTLHLPFGWDELQFA